MENSEEIINGFELPYHVNEILPDPNLHKIHRKPLMNAENMVKKGKYKSALEIYARITSKFPEPEIRAKINEIVEKLEEFIQKQDKTYTRKFKHPSEEKSEKEFQEKDFSAALRELSDDLTRSLKEGLDNLEAIHSELPKEIQEISKDTPLPTEKQETTQNEKRIPQIIIATTPLDEKKLNNLSLTYSLPENQTQPLPEKTIETLSKLADSLKDFPVVETPPNLEAKKLNLETAITGKEETKESPQEQPVSDSKFQDLLNKLNLGLPSGLPAADWTKKSNLEHTLSSLTGTMRSAVDILAELYHSEDWKPFRHLPLVDRRSGKDRRTKNIPVEKERRSGIERRKVDLFKQREDFLKNWSAQIQARFPHLALGSIPTGEEISSITPTDYTPKNLEDSSALGTLSFSPAKNEATSKIYKPTDFGIVGMPESLKEGDFVPSYIPIGLPGGIHSRRSDIPSIDQNSISQTTPIPETPIPKVEPVPANREYVREVGYPSEFELVKIGLPEPQTIHLESFAGAPKRNIAWELPAESALHKVLAREPSREISEKEFEELKNLTTQKVLYPTIREETVHELFKIDLPNPIDTKVGKSDDIFGTPGAMPKVFEDTTPPDVEIVESETPPPEQEVELPAIEPPTIEAEPERMIHGILELKPPEVDDAPFLTLTYDFSKIPHSFRLSKNYSLMEYSYYKYKPMLMKAQEFARRKMLKNALNYYRVIKSQNIPPELKKMINRNIMDITEFLEKYLMSKGS